MKNKFQKLIAVWLLLGMSVAAQAGDFKAKNVVILVIDGPRQTECWADPKHENIPNMANVLAPQGTLYLGFKNNGPTYTSAGHTAITTGFYEDLENSVGNDFPSHPGIFQAFLKQTGLPQSSAWVITTKGKLKLLTDTKNPEAAGKFKPSYWGGADGAGNGYGMDKDTMAKVEEVLVKTHPRLMLINLKEPDSSGHSGVWKDYIAGLQASDGYALKLWKILQSEGFYKDKTALFITHDHGRHRDGVETGFKDHGDICSGCRAIALLALGPDFKKGETIHDTGEQIDIPPTVAKILAFTLEGQKGRVLEEMFR